MHLAALREGGGRSASLMLATSTADPAERSLAGSRKWEGATQCEPNDARRTASPDL
jgi:aminopeptidase N